ncbi:MAG: hypothetical protein Q4G05_00120 [Clostridia bacterium]|nr:hypothetical protein [Clostridia bacterium]
MKFPDNLLEYLSDSVNVLQAGILVTDLTNIVYSNVSYYNFPDTYANKEISTDIKNTISKWSNTKDFEESFFEMRTTDTINIINNDTSNYTGQIIFPIYHKGKLAGTFICFRLHKDYVDTSVKPAMTTRHFVELMSNDNYILQKGEL